MRDKKIIPPNLVIQAMERSLASLDGQIEETVKDLDTLWDSYQKAGEHLDTLRERKDQYTQAIRLLQ